MIVERNVKLFTLHSVQPVSSITTKASLFKLDRLMYCFHASDPDSLPPPVAFSPPKAPPISAPDVGMFTLTIPQSEHLGPNHLKTFPRSFVNMEEERPCSTSLFQDMPS